MVKKIVALAFVIAILSIIGWKIHVHKSEGPITPDSIFDLGDKELVITIQRARNNDLAAIERLISYYAITKEDKDSAFFWWEKAAELGDKNAQENVVDALSDSKKSEDRAKARELEKRWNLPKSP